MPTARVLAAAQQGVAADERRRSAFGLPLALAAERRYVGRTAFSAKRGLSLLEFLKRFAFGRTPPKREWINLVGDDIAFERDTGEVRVWRFSDGDALGVYFFN